MMNSCDIMTKGDPMKNTEIELYNEKVKVFNLKLESIKEKEANAIKLHLEGKLSKTQLKKIKIQTCNELRELNKDRPILPKSLQKALNPKSSNLLTLMALFNTQI